LMPGAPTSMVRGLLLNFRADDIFCGRDETRTLASQQSDHRVTKQMGHRLLVLSTLAMESYDDAQFVNRFISTLRLAVWLEYLEFICDKCGFSLSHLSGTDSTPQQIHVPSRSLHPSQHSLHHRPIFRHPDMREYGWRGC
jgi:hypothetical protein